MRPLAAILLGMLPSTVFAHTEVCVSFLATYGDNGSGSQGAGDYWTTNATRPMPGVEIKLWDIQAQAWLPSVFADFDGANQGCATIPTTPWRSYYAFARSRSRIKYGNTVEVLNPATVSGGDFLNQGSPYISYLRTIGHNSHTSSILPGNRFTVIQGAAVWALQRRNAGLGSTLFRIFNRRCPTGNFSCWHNSSNAMFTNSDSKFVYIHELGHAIGAMRNANVNGPQSTNQSYQADATICGGAAGSSHAMDTKEYQSGAAGEGFGHYYAAVTWNVSTQMDCEFGYYKVVDFNHDGTNDSQRINCQTDPTLNTPPGGSPPPPAAPFDYLGDQCVVEANRATEYDWLRFWWDIDVFGGMNTTDIADIWDDANPYSWRADDNGNADLPRDRIQQGFINQGEGAQWTFTAGLNGVDQ